MNGIEEWKSWQEKGRWKYVLTNTISFGIILLIINILVSFIGDNTIKLTFLNIIKLLAISLLGGFGYGLTMWYWFQWYYGRKEVN